MYISEIPVRCPSTASSNDSESSIQWISDLTARTTARDVITSILPSTADSNRYALYLNLGRHRHLLKDSARIYKVVASMNQHKSARRLMFEIRLKKVKKRVRFADEILVQTIVQGHGIAEIRSTTNQIETVSTPSEKTKENYTFSKQFSKSPSSIAKRYVIDASPCCHSLSAISFVLLSRSSLRIIAGNISPSSSESGISSHLSNDDIPMTNKFLETLV